MKKIILFVSAIFCLFFVMNCSSLQRSKPHIQREWMLVSFDRFTKQQLIKSKAGINLTGEKEDGKIKGTSSMGCNRIFFTSEFKINGKMNISGLGGTEMACEDMDLENAFMEKFKNMKSYTIEGHYLILSDEKGNQMKFIAADWD